MSVGFRQEDNGGMSLTSVSGRRIAFWGGGGSGLNQMVGQVTRTDLAANPKRIGLLPRGAIPVSLRWAGAANSDAATAATIKVGYDGGVGSELLGATTCKSGSTAWQYSTNGTVFHQPVTADTGVVAVYAETGVSTTGGPWTFVVEYFLPE